MNEPIFFKLTELDISFGDCCDRQSELILAIDSIASISEGTIGRWVTLKNSTFQFRVKETKEEILEKLYDSYNRAHGLM